MAPNDNQPVSFKLLLTIFLIQLLLADPYSETFCRFPKDPSFSLIKNQQTRVVRAELSEPRLLRWAGWAESD